MQASTSAETELRYTLFLLFLFFSPFSLTPLFFWLDPCGNKAQAAV
jgi:hypothetical protein